RGRGRAFDERVGGGAVADRVDGGAAAVEERHAAAGAGHAAARVLHVEGAAGVSRAGAEEEAARGHAAARERDEGDVGGAGRRAIRQLVTAQRDRGAARVVELDELVGGGGAGGLDLVDLHAAGAAVRVLDGQIGGLGRVGARQIGRATAVLAGRRAVGDARQLEVLGRALVDAAAVDARLIVGARRVVRGVAIEAGAAQLWTVTTGEERGQDDDETRHVGPCRERWRAFTEKMVVWAAFGVHKQLSRGNSRSSRMGQPGWGANHVRS